MHGGLSSSFASELSLVSSVERHDTCNMTVILVPCALAALLLTSDYSLLEVLWTFSEFTEGFAMARGLRFPWLFRHVRLFRPQNEVPQYIFCYRERVNKDVPSPRILEKRDDGLVAGARASMS